MTPEDDGLRFIRAFLIALVPSLMLWAAIIMGALALVKW